MLAQVRSIALAVPVGWFPCGGSQTAVAKSVRL
jgi:hypothetical protein